MSDAGPSASPGASPPPLWTRRHRAAFAALAVLILLSAGTALILRRDFDRPADPAREVLLLVEVRPGSGVRRISHELKAKGLLRRPLAFQLQARLRGGARRIRAGVYELSPAMPPRAIYRILIEGRVAQRTVTIPEGYNLREIAEALERAGLGPRKDIIESARDPALLARAEAEGDSIEGYLFPDTYRFPLGTPPREILFAMSQNLRRKFGPSLRERAQRLGLTPHEALTLASLIEKETPLAAERALVAAVFWNRLRKNIPLQSDPTAVYGLPRPDGPIRRRDLAHDSPYNTYIHRGLPPGPIASPGLASIEAALHPADVDYLYFVATPSGGHAFSRTYPEHQAAIARHQTKRKETVDPKTP